jgi:hypothetical protein
MSSGSRRDSLQTPLAVCAGEGTLPCSSGGRAQQSSGMLGGLRREAGGRLSGPLALLFAQQACSIATDSISPNRFELPHHQINHRRRRIELHNHQIALHSRWIDLRRRRFEACCHRIELRMRSWRAWPLYHVLFLQQGWVKRSRNAATSASRALCSPCHRTPGAATASPRGFEVVVAGFLLLRPDQVFVGLPATLVLAGGKRARSRGRRRRAGGGGTRDPAHGGDAIRRPLQRVLGRRLCLWERDGGDAQAVGLSRQGGFRKVATIQTPLADVLYMRLSHANWRRDVPEIKWLFS